METVSNEKMNPNRIITMLEEQLDLEAEALKYMVAPIREKLGISDERLQITLKEYGANDIDNPTVQEAIYTLYDIVLDDFKERVIGYQDDRDITVVECISDIDVEISSNPESHGFKGVFSEFNFQDTSDSNIKLFLEMFKEQKEKKERQTTIQGCIIPTKETWFQLQPETPDEEIEFGFSACETGYIYPDGTVWYNDEGTESYKFKNREDAFDFFFNADELLCPEHSYEFQVSRRIGSREEDPALEQRCKDQGIEIDDEEDGDSVYSAYETCAVVINGGVK